MQLRSGKMFGLSSTVNQPFKLILLPVKIPKKDKPYEVNIDFDESSKKWRENKVKVGESFVYK
jgi:hypothetical protein|tara:strand:- start:1212 stop:1400 length:189 start_codon:yes stop_codon:yes gene_type:complete